jgi:hypothetical protein
MYILPGQARVDYLLHDVNMALHCLIFRVIPLNIPRGGGWRSRDGMSSLSPHSSPPPLPQSLGRRETERDRLVRFFSQRTRGVMKNLFIKGKVSRDFHTGFHDYLPLPALVIALLSRRVFRKFAKIFTPATLSWFRKESCSYFVLLPLKLTQLVSFFCENRSLTASCCFSYYLLHPRYWWKWHRFLKNFKCSLWLYKSILFPGTNNVLAINSSYSPNHLKKIK